MIKIPGKSEREPNSYPFGTSYDFIYDDLKNKDQELYTKNGMLHIMERNRRIKVRKNCHGADYQSHVFKHILTDFEIYCFLHAPLPYFLFPLWFLF